MQCLTQQTQKKQLAISTSPRDCISVEINCYFNLVFFALTNPDELKKHLQRWMHAIGPQIGHIMFNCTSGWLVFPAEATENKTTATKPLQNTVIEIITLM